DLSSMVSGDPVSTMTGISCPLFKWSATRIWSPRPAPLFKGVSRGSGGRIEPSASQFGVVAQEHQNIRQTPAPITRTRPASRAGIVLMVLISKARGVWFGVLRSPRQEALASVPQTKL